MQILEREATNDHLPNNPCKILPALFIMTHEGGSVELRSFLNLELGGSGRAASLPAALSLQKGRVLSIE
jgi:hypothetical protein